MKHSGHLVAQVLAEYGVEVIFGMPGGQTAALYDGIKDLYPRLRHVLVRDERSAGYAADAYARLTGKVGVCDATVGPGATKFVDGLGEALNNSIPLVAIVGELPRDWAPLRELGVASQACDQPGFLRPVTKAVYEVPSQAALPHLLRSAFRTATSNRPGPVAVIIPYDIFDAPWAESAEDVAVDTVYGAIPPHRPCPPPEQITAAARLMSASQRPVIVAGGGVLLSGAESELATLAHMLQASVVTSLTGKGAFAEDDPLSGGVLCPLGPAAAEELARAADLLILVGTKCSQNTTINWTIPATGQATIHIDIDAQQLGRTFRPTLALQGDAAQTLAAIVRALPDQMPRTAWLEMITAVRQNSDALAHAGADVITPPQVMQELAVLLRPDDIVISDASFSAGWVATHLRAAVPGRHFLFGRGLGAMGYALPAAIGAASARPGSRIITVNGDASICLGIGELSTLFQYGYKVTNIVLNNRMLGWIKYLQRMHYNERYVSTDMPEIDFATVARGFGCHGESVQEPAQLRGALERAFNADVPSVVDVRCDVWQTPIRSFVRRLQERGAAYDPPGAKYTLRPWVQSPDLAVKA